MTLSNDQRRELLDFIKSHYVDYHDVRLLIARDLEKDILKQMEKDENLSFEEALEQAYKKYGVIGFSDVSEDYMKKINTYFYKKVILNVLKDELSTLRFWGIVIIGFSFIYALIFSLKSVPIILVGGFLILIILGLIFYFRKLHKEVKKLKTKDKYYYLDQLLISNNSILFPFTYLPLLVAPHVGRLTENEYWSISILAIFTTISFIAFYLIYFRLYKNRSEIVEAYESNFLAKKLNYKFEVL